MDSIPVALRPLVSRLQSIPDLSRRDLISALVVVRLGDSLHRAFNGTFLTLELVSRLCEKLEIPQLTLEVDVYQTRWNFRQGEVSAVHRIMWDYDMYSVQILTKIGRGILNECLTPKEGLRLIREHEVKTDYTIFERGYRTFPTRMFVLPLMAATCATVFFEGTWYDFGFAAACGMAAGLVAWLCSLSNHLLLVMDYLAAIATGMISMASVSAYPDATCFSAQVTGTLYWFLYGTAFVLSLYEITSNQLIAGLTRFGFAVVKSYGLAFGAMLGVWFAAYAGYDRLDNIVDQVCTEQSHQISDLWFILLYPLAAIACLMQFRVGLKIWPVCLLVQTIAYGSQYALLNVWKYPDFLANLIPAFLATLASHACVVVLPRLQNYVGVDTIDRFDLALEETSKPAQDTLLHTDEEKKEESKQDPLSNTHDEENAEEEDSERISFINTGWAGAKGHIRSDMRPRGSVGATWLAGKDAAGYVQDTQEDDKLSDTRSGTWFCLLPALYLLVPGSKLLQNAVVSLLASSSETHESELTSLASSYFEIGLSQAIGLRLGFAVLWACDVLWMWMRNRCCRSTPREAGN